MRIVSNTRLFDGDRLVFDGHNAPTARGNEWFLRRMFNQTSTLGSRALKDADAEVLGYLPATSATASFAPGSVAGQGRFTVTYAPTTGPALISVGDPWTVTLPATGVAYQYEIVSVVSNAGGNAVFQISPRVPTATNVRVTSAVRVESNIDMSRSALATQAKVYSFSGVPTTGTTYYGVRYTFAGVGTNNVIAVAAIPPQMFTTALAYLAWAPTAGLGTRPSFTAPSGAGDALTDADVDDIAHGVSGASPTALGPPRAVPLAANAAVAGLPVVVGSTLNIVAVANSDDYLADWAMAYPVIPSAQRSTVNGYAIQFGTTGAYKYFMALTARESDRTDAYTGSFEVGTE